MELPDAVASLSTTQQGLATRAQLRAAGVTPAAMRWRLGRDWTLVLPTVVLLRRGPLEMRQRLVAAVLEAGPDAVVSGQHACAWHGLSSARMNGPVDVLVPVHLRARNRAFVRIRRTRRIDSAPVRRPGLLIASTARAVVDCARWSRLPDESLAVVLEAVQRRLVTVEQLEHEVEAAPMRGSAQARQAVLAAREGAWSVPEHALIRLCSQSRSLPIGFPNPQLSTSDGAPLISPDLWFDDAGLAVMVHSRAHHARDAQWESTVARDGELTAHGVLVLAFTPSTIAATPATVLRRIEQAYTAALSGGRRRPPVVMVPRGWGRLIA